MMIMTTIVTSLVLGVVWQKDTPSTSSPVRADIRAITASVQNLASTDQNVVNDAIEQLRSQPSIPIITALGKALDGGGEFDDLAVRDRAYGILKIHRAATYDIGFSILVRELQRPGGTRVLPMLRLTPPAKYKDLAVALSPLLAIPPDRQRYEQSEILKLLAITGPAAKETLPQIARLWRDRTNDFSSPIDDSTFYMTMAVAMLQVGGPQWALMQFQIEEPATHDPVDLIPILTAMAKVGADTEGKWNAEAAQRQEVRDVMLGATRHKELEVRRAAATALGYGYSIEDLVVKNAAGEYRINPDLAEAFQHMLQNERDHEMRAFARRAIEEWFPREIRKRQEASTQLELP